LAFLKNKKNQRSSKKAKDYKFGLKKAELATLCRTTSLTTAELRHKHYNIVCDVTHRTVFAMSSRWMI